VLIVASIRGSAHPHMPTHLHADGNGVKCVQRSTSSGTNAYRSSSETATTAGGGLRAGVSWRTSAGRAGHGVGRGPTHLCP
jgi:hypothetical protein